MAIEKTPSVPQQDRSWKIKTKTHSLDQIGACQTGCSPGAVYSDLLKIWRRLLVLPMREEQGRRGEGFQKPSFEGKYRASWGSAYTRALQLPSVPC